MACVIAAPSSGSGKTLLSLLLLAWTRTKGLSLQSFKVGPDYLDSQQLSAIATSPCRNLDLILCGETWVKDSFHGYGGNSQLALIEGVMGLFDGVGASEKGSTADIARHLNLPIVLVIDARGQAASIGALVQGFRQKDPKLKLAGVVLNHVKTSRHKKLLTEVLNGIGVKVLGCMTPDPQLDLPSQHLGLAPAHEIEDLDKRIVYWSRFAERSLDIEAFLKLLKGPTPSLNPIEKLFISERVRTISNPTPIAIAEDKAFHFRYPETKECLEKLGMPIIEWKPTLDEEIPKEARGLIIPGGFPEKYAYPISKSMRSINSLRKNFQKIPIYAECGGMLLLGRKLTNLQEEEYQMAGILPFTAQKGSLKIGYRNINCHVSGLISKKGDQLLGHEFHNWELSLNTNLDQKSLGSKNFPDSVTADFSSPWRIKGWEIIEQEEGWTNNMLHASWIHLHWPSSIKVLNNWKEKCEDHNSNT